MRRFLLLLAMCFLLPGVSQGQEAVYMRVVARNDSPAAQAEKRLVRNAALLLGESRVCLLEKLVPQCKVEYRQWQPEKKLPAGRTVYITLGPGAGRNWWGVLCPDAVSWTQEAGRTGWSFPILEWLCRLFTGC